MVGFKPELGRRRVNLLRAFVLLLGACGGVRGGAVQQQASPTRSPPEKAQASTSQSDADAACGALAAYNASRGMELHVDSEVASVLAQCIRGERGVWGWRIESWKSFPPNQDPEAIGPCDDSYEGKASVQWCPFAVSKPCASARAVRTFSFSQGCVGERHVLQPGFDYDDDGVPEVVVETSRDGEGAHFRAGKMLLSYRGSDGLFPLRFDGGFELTLQDEPFELKDIDRDGRPDIVSTAWHVDFDTSLPVSYAYHALRTGRFSDDDAVAKEQWASWCPSPPRRLREHASTWGDVGAHIVCARSWGMSESRLRAQLRTECPSFVDMSSDWWRWNVDPKEPSCPSQLDDMAHADPPVDMP